MIRVQNLSVQYGQIAALADISLEVCQGEFVLLTGASGCGKSTLAQAMAGLIPSALPARMQGNVTVCGMDTREHVLPELAQRVGLVFQNPASQLFHLKVAEEVAFGPRNLGISTKEIEDRVAWALKATGLTSLRDRRPQELSGGQKQCLAIAAALALRPDVLILDEPTASLDVANSRRIIDTLSQLHQQYKITIFLVEHRFAEAVRCTERVLVMDEGRIIADGSPQEVLAEPSLNQRLGLRRLADHPPSDWKSLIQPNGHRNGEDEPLLVLKDVSAGYNRRAVIQNINLQIYPGDFTALVGKNGAGKSTLGRVAAGLLKPLQGQVRYLGGRRPRPGLDVSILFQNPLEQLFTDQVFDEVAFGPQNYAQYNAQVVQEVLDKADLVRYQDRSPLALSVGQQQRTALAACIALHPRLLILDEPTLGQDWGHLQQLMDYLSRLNQEGVTILLISHDYKLVHHYAKNVLLMESGQIVRNGHWKD